jgi:hypothetical protein
MEWAAVISALAGLLLYVLQRYDAGKPQRDIEARHDEIQQGRKDIADGNIAAVNERVDRLLAGDTERKPSGEVTAGRLSAVSRVVDSGRSPGKDSGESGELR